MTNLNGTASNTFVYCRCVPVQQCPNRAEVCASTTGCFYSVTLDPSHTRILSEAFGCYPNHTNHVDLHCRPSLLLNPRVFCCRVADGHFCNHDLAVKFSRLSNKASALPKAVAILLPLCVLILGLIIIALLWHFVLRVRLNNLARRFQIAPPDKPGELQNLLVRLRRCCCPWLVGRRRSSRETLLAVSLPMGHPCCPQTHELLSYTSGSGSGLPFLVQRTIARHIQLIACIGTGRFGEVWRATCQGELVAVKIFSSRDESSWARETEVYNTGLLQHPNLLAYYASDMISRGGCTQLWLITAYHANGSIHDYLKGKSLTIQEGLRLARSTCAGLAFLHTEICGVHAKPPIAHRDIKSKNVLVRHDLEACIADLGLALIQSKPSVGTGDNIRSLSACSAGLGTVSKTFASDYIISGLSSPSSIGPPPAGPRVGTKRYMAPELLLAVEGSHAGPDLCLEHLVELSEVNGGDLPAIPYLPFEVYQAADVYALSLVFWEIIRSTQGCDADASAVEGYQIPYHDMVPADPTFSQMRDVVCHGLSAVVSAEQPNSEPGSVLDQCTVSGQTVSKGLRPPISSRWLIDPLLTRWVSLIQECWHGHWESRLPALRIRKTLEAMEASLDVSKTSPSEELQKEQSKQLDR